jgi:hypothetical protein
MVFSSTPKYVTIGELCHMILAILRGECWRKNGPLMKIKRTLVIQAGGRRMKNQNQKMTSSTTEEYIIKNINYWTNLSC